MPIHNAFATDGQNRPFPAALQTTGPIVAIEIGVHPQLAAALTQQGQVVPAAVAG